MPDFKRIGIIGAEEAEVAPLLDMLETRGTVGHSAFTYHECRYKGREVILVRCGIGKVAAAACTQALISAFDVDAVIFSGIAGGVGGGLKVGDIVVSVDTVQHDFDVTPFGRLPGEVPPPGERFVKADGYLRGLAVRAGQGLDWPGGRVPRIVEGRILTGDQFIADSEKVERLSELFQGHAAEMEGAAIAQVCSWSRVPFVIIRSISDTADEEAKISFDTFLELEGKRAASLVLRMLDMIG